MCIFILTSSKRKTKKEIVSKPVRRGANNHWIIGVIPSRQAIHISVKIFRCGGSALLNEDNW